MDDLGLSLDLPTYRIRNSADVMYYFQQYLNKFPRVEVNGQERLMFAEFGAYFIRPKGEPKNQLTHLLFPETIITVPDADLSLGNKSETSFPQIMLMADAETNDLYLKVISHSVNKEGYLVRSSLILGMDEAFFISDIWDAVSPQDKIDLQEQGFGPGMSHAEWAESINKYQASRDPLEYPRNGKRIMLRELPILIARRGAMGTNGTYKLLPEFTLYALTNNRFIYEEVDIPDNKEEILFESGDVHIHSLVNKMGPQQSAVAKLVGADVMRRNPSVPDIRHQRAQNSIFKEVSSKYGDRVIDTMNTFAGIITVDALGVVTGARYFDYYNADLDEMARLNDAAWKTMYKDPNPDVNIIAEHYRFMDSVTTEDFGTDDASPHVGDPDYDRRQDSSGNKAV